MISRACENPAYGTAHEILVLIMFAQKPPLHAYALLYMGESSEFPNS